MLKTPGRPQPTPPGGAPAAAPPAAPGAGGPNAAAPPGLPPGPPPAAAAPFGPAPVVGEDPMAGVKQGPKEIDFKPKGGNFTVSFNLEEADLNELVKAISNITGRRFIYGGKLRQIKATVYSPDKVTVQEAYSAFLSILETNGLTVIPHGRFLKIVETPGVVSQTTPIYGAGTAVPAEDRFITRMYRVSSVDPNEAANVLGKFKSKEGDITVHPSGNLIIMTDTGSNVQRMIRILEDIDVGGAGDQIWFEPIHYAGANDVAMKLNEILDLKPGGGKAGARGGPAGGAGGGAGGARILADDRTNSLVITANQPDYMRLLELIKRMDVPQSGDGQMHVLPLQHAGCKDLSGTLNQLLGGATGGGGGGAAPGGRRGAQAAPPVPGSTEDIFEGQVKITCDEGSNKLVVTSSLRDYAALRSVIDELDQPRRQVFIEAVIMDVNVNRTNEVGVRWHMGAPFTTGIEGTTDPAAVYGGNDMLTSLGAPTSPTLASQLGALALGVRGPTITNFLSTGISIPAFGVIMHAIATDNDSNVLATPHILATDNIPATIEIGQNVPLQTNIGGGLGALAGAAGGAGGAAGGLGGLGGLGLLGGGFSAPRQDVGTKIEVTPHVNDSDQVRLEITEGISELGPPAGGDLGAITIIKRNAKTTLVVRDQQTVVIGGLMRDAVTNKRTKIPILGDIPVLGALFRTTTKTTSKTNLLLVLTPYIIRDQEDLRAIFERKMQERQEFLDRYFVFSGSDWEPPKDYARANGLVEDIRQSQIQMADRVRREEEARPKGPRSHEPGQPIAVPSIAIRGAGDDGGGAVQTATPPPNTGNAPAAPTPRRRPGGAAAPRPVERVE